MSYTNIKEHQLQKHEPELHLCKSPLDLVYKHPRNRLCILRHIFSDKPALQPFSCLCPQILKRQVALQISSLHAETMAFKGRELKFAQEVFILEAAVPHGIESCNMYGIHQMAHRMLFWADLE